MATRQKKQKKQIQIKVVGSSKKQKGMVQIGGENEEAQRYLMWQKGVKRLQSPKKVDGVTHDHDQAFKFTSAIQLNKIDFPHVVTVFF